MSLSKATVNFPSGIREERLLISNYILIGLSLSVGRSLEVRRVVR